MNHLLLVSPVLLPLLSAAGALLLWGNRRAQRVVSITGATLLLTSAVALCARVWRGGILVTQIGSWPAPFGISFVADIFAAIMVLLGAVVGVTVVLYSFWGLDSRREAFGFHPLVHALLLGVCGAFLTGDIFNLYVWFEVMLIASFVLMGLGGERAQMEGAIKYVVINLVSSAFFLGAVGILYRLTGTLNMADLSVALAKTKEHGSVLTVAMLFLVAFGIKAAVFPLFFWLPASYHTPPVVISALFAGLLTKVGVYAIIRVFTLMFIHDVGYTHTLILAISGLTMVTGVLGATAQRDVRRILSFHIVSQIGYMIMGLGIYTPMALAGSVFYIVHHIIVKTNLFLISGIMRRSCGSFHLDRCGGLYQGNPVLGILFLVSALSLAGLPPLSGFFAKVILVRAGLEAGSYAIVATALAVSLLTLYSMTKIWSEAFWKPPPGDDGAPSPILEPSGEAAPGRPGLFLPVAALAGITVTIGILGGPLFAIASAAAQQLLEPSRYVNAVLAAEG